ncbi:hypothetical protein Nepgr_028967 [Nepenthes gracilis]|uniref:Alkaline/neutral invertase n=1 Tax=Nepenthes gracilis TaxID=150966 RepID=A0AAD3TDW2_NEPGR|nr:hypothetical protein Nepgr_028967 [Nepenthes gracilis]
MDYHSPKQGLTPANFKVRPIPLDSDDSTTKKILDPNFGKATIGHVAPINSRLWWLILFHAYGRCSRDHSVQEKVDVPNIIQRILKLCLGSGFDMFPTLLVIEGSCLIDHRMGIHGHPLEIQGSGKMQSFSQFVKQLEEFFISCRRDKRIFLLKKWMVALKEVKRINKGSNGEKHTEQGFKEDEDIPPTRVLYRDLDHSGEPLNFHDVFLHSKAHEIIIFSMILEAPNEEVV